MKTEECSILKYTSLQGNPLLLLQRTSKLERYVCMSCKVSLTSTPWHREVGRVQARAHEVVQRKEALVQAMQQRLDDTNDAVYQIAEQAGMAL